ncbi:MAG: hypothetical protein MUC88_11235 [Planctomycetes bacterium]|jgi:hypothetical protein|nr:hypothetical protein [Planctomycetota bacterium]
MTRNVHHWPRLRQIVLVTLLGCSAATAAPTLEFQLHDAWGRTIRAQDYRGRPIFLEFGACW